MILTVQRHDRAHIIQDAGEKLRWRSTLPGASVWDRGAHALRVLQGQAHDAVALLPLAMPLSWMVNAKASSVLIQRWLAPPLIDAWSAVLDGLDFAMSLDAWLTLDEGKRATIANAISILALADPKQGSSLAAVTKVLALLRPQLVPLMDDAAIWFALGTVDEPTTADAPSAPPSLFMPMLDWFARQAIDQERALTKLAAAHELATLDAPQVLDRLLWVESWGERSRTRK